MKRLRTLRHPNILRYVGNFDVWCNSLALSRTRAHQYTHMQTPTHIYLVTEAATPLYAAQEEENNEMGNAWGIHQIAVRVRTHSDTVL